MLFLSFKYKYLYITFQIYNLINDFYINLKIFLFKLIDFIYNLIFNNI